MNKESIVFHTSILIASMEDKSIADIVGGLRCGETIQISYMDNLHAIEIFARKEMYHRGPASGSSIKICAEELMRIPPEHRDIYVRNTIRTVLEQVRDSIQAKKDLHDAEVQKYGAINRKDE